MLMNGHNDFCTGVHSNDLSLCDCGLPSKPDGRSEKERLQTAVAEIHSLADRLKRAEAENEAMKRVVDALVEAAENCTIHIGTDFNRLWHGKLMEAIDQAKALHEKREQQG